MIVESRGSASALTHRLASAGCRGRYPNNVPRDINRALQLPVDLHYCTIPVRSESDRKTETEMRSPFIMPHELYAYLMDSGKIRVTPAELEDYWEHLAARARANQLPIPTGYDKRAVPLGMYGDDARYNTSGDIARYPVWTLREFICLGARTWNPIMRILSWSFNIIYFGVYPTFNLDGVRLAGAAAKVAGTKMHNIPFLLPGHLHDSTVGNYPCLTLKAHSGRIWLAYMHECLSHEKKASADDEVQMAYLVVHHLATWFHVMETSPRRKVTPEQAGKMMDAGMRFLKVHEHLVYYASQHHLLRWKAFRHILEDCEMWLESPRATHCFRDEDFIGQWKKLAQGSGSNSIVIVRFFLLGGVDTKYNKFNRCHL
ncbi:unnamed protein product [Symbiodinium sp. CCMP2592]|nr:unnamed protein product [Symbiodinium sp. CCMP2592]